LLADKQFFMADAFGGDDSVPDIWTNSEAEIWMDIDEGGFGANEFEGTRLSGVDDTYTDGDSSVPEPLDSAEMEGGEFDEPNEDGVFTTRKKRLLKKGNMLV